MSTYRFNNTSCCTSKRLQMSFKSILLFFIVILLSFYTTPILKTFYLNCSLVVLWLIVGPLAKERLLIRFLLHLFISPWIYNVSTDVNNVLNFLITLIWIIFYWVMCGKVFWCVTRLASIIWLLIVIWKTLWPFLAFHLKINY